MFILYCTSNHPGASGKELNKFFPPNNSDDLCLIFCKNPSSMLPINSVGIKTSAMEVFYLPRPGTHQTINQLSTRGESNSPKFYNFCGQQSM